MNVNKKATSLYQSMDLWIALYRRIHECDHNTAHDAFDEWADSLQGESGDQSTPQFHAAVDASYAKMLAANPTPGVIILDKPPAPKEVSYTNTKGETVTTKPLGNLVGGPLLELPHESRLAEGSLVSTNIREEWKNTKWSEPGQRQGGPVGGPILDTGKDPLAFQESCKEERTPPPVLAPAEVRAQVEKVIRQANERLAELGDTGNPIDIDYATKTKELAESRLRLIDEIEERTKSRKGTLSLPRK